MFDYLIDEYLEPNDVSLSDLTKNKQIKNNKQKEAIL